MTGARFWRRAGRGLPGLLLLVALVLPRAASAQLISPGKLSAAHAQLDGISHCTQCHEPGHRGPSAERCLACHVPLQRRIAVDEGYHASVAGKPCQACHKEHFGRGFQLVRLDTATFRHDVTGFVLRGAHARTACHDCHEPAHITSAEVRRFMSKHGALSRTMLGLSTACVSCHRSDDPHGGQFAGRRCDACHDASTWKRAPRFDHDSARFRLTGAHVRVKCDACHRPVRPGGPARFAGLHFSSCASCHKDPHNGAMGSDCTSCHVTASWKRLSSRALAHFDHTRTGFALVGAHASLRCGDCHNATQPAGIRIRFARSTLSNAFPRPLGKACTSCHLDVHRGAFAHGAPGPSCDNCHTQRSWSPSTFGLRRHDRVAQFKLTGAHAATPCNQCHRPARPGAMPRFRFASLSCRTCHRQDDPHKGRFGTASCDRCHDTSSFKVRSFDHSLVNASQCRSCHAADSPHGGQFGHQSCAGCHDTHSFHIARFDHSRTRFPLTGKHAQAPCAACHRRERTAAGKLVVRYRPLPTDCVACHGGKSQ